MRARTRRRVRAGYQGVLLLALLGTGCATKGAGDTRRELLASWSTGIAVEGYRSFEDATRTLDAALVDYCAEPSDLGLEAARAAWWQARAPWEQLEVFTFGPYSRLPLRIGPQIDQWPQRSPLDQVEALLESERAVTPEAVHQMGINQKGLPVAEYLLYAPDAASALANARRCEYLVSVGKELVARATELREAWDPAVGDFAGELSEAGRGRSAFDDLTDAFSEVVNRMAFTLENLRTEKLIRPLGPANGAPAPELVESPFSGRAIEDMRDNISGIELVYFGDPARNVLGLESYLSERGRSYAPQMTEQLSAVRGALDAIPEPMTDAVSSARERIEAAGDTVNELRDLIQIDIINTLGLQVSFNDNDGD